MSKTSQRTNQFCYSESLDLMWVCIHLFVVVFFFFFITYYYQFNVMHEKNSFFFFSSLVCSNTNHETRIRFYCNRRHQKMWKISFFSPKTFSLSLRIIFVFILRQTHHLTFNWPFCFKYANLCKNSFNYSLVEMGEKIFYEFVIVTITKLETMCNLKYTKSKVKCMYCDQRFRFFLCVSSLERQTTESKLHFSL